ncbi:peptidase S24 [Pseudomonas gingeri NCPPB 3146 = LMG 5327]|uniref:Peptidase S24 n=2 Tax=Pseudomonas gingeri TaxID=117681 RepID=A0A7Y7XUZ1_9PSED|nr:S24 family peptidase [Pseudomonas gingeri]NWC12440.1 peptidase S24 [Pseudomonas gingeri]PNQ89195.1 peptidase S24 [Pseudomonas gingeri NCPPB 3146 = LMG 5327]
MIDKENIRLMFAERLHAALDSKGIRQHGRGADIIQQLKSKGVVKTAQAVSKWLNGAALPELDSLTVLSEWLGVRREWLEHGVMPVFPSQTLSQPHYEDAGNVSQIASNMARVPLISWVQAGSWSEVSSSVESVHAEQWLPCPAAISKSGYALRVVGDSMTNYGPGKSYPAGCIIFVDPELATNNGDRVIASIPSSNEATFKVLVEDAGKHYLKPINPQYPIIEITEDMQICGKVVGAFMPE